MKKTFLVVVLMALLLLNIVIAANESVSVTTIKCDGGTYEIINDTIKCVTCASGFAPSNGTCILKTQQLNTESAKKTLIQRFDQFIDDNGTQIAPANPTLGKVVLFIVAIVFLHYLLVGAGKVLRGRRK